jgi:hypothetical protein
MRRFALTLVLLVAWPVTALAQKSCDELRAELAALATTSALNRLSVAGCLGGERDPHPATRRAQRLFDGAKDLVLSTEERRALTVAVLRAANESLGSLSAPEASRLRATIAQAMRDRSQGVDSPAQRATYWSWDPQQATLGDTGIDAAALPRDSAESLLRAARLAERAFAPDQARAIEAAAARASARDARWRSYFAEARSQYPWELALNSWRYEATVRDKVGVSGPPDWQWIALHPDVGMQYLGSAAPGDRLKPALVLEIVGYNRWSWGNDNRASGAWGASLVRTYADTASAPTGAWGLAIHRNSKYSLTIIRSEGHAGFVLSIDLAGAVTAASEEWRDRFRIGR